MVLFARFQLVQAAENQGENHEHCADPLGGTSQLCIESLGVALGHERISCAGDCTGETCGLTGLEQNSKNNSETGNYLQNSEKRNHAYEILHLLFIYAKT